MKLTNFAALTWMTGAVVASALPAKRDDEPSKCTNPEKRRSWHDISDEEKKAYLAANKCVLTSPQKLNRIPGAKTRWDELVALHQIHALQIHTTGQFLPYHRYYLKTHEFLLRECGYEGAIPYWDETRDAGNFANSVIFDPVTGFGGDGRQGDLCVTDGPFVNLTVNIGPGFTNKPRCVNRKISDWASGQTGSKYVEDALNHTDYAGALDGIYMGPHLWGHIALAMMDGNSITSSGDPLFFMHHGFVDKLWADWQARDPKRLTDISGPNYQDPDVGFKEIQGDMEEEAKIWGKPSEELLAVTPDPQAGDDGPELTLNHIMSSLGIIPNATVADIMDTKGGFLCYEYV